MSGVRESKRGGYAGQTLIEVALVLPLLLAMVLGSIEFGRYAYLSILVGDAAHAGALYGAQNGINAANAPGIIAAADSDYANNGQSVSTLTVTTWQGCGCDSGGTYTQLASTAPPNNSASCTATYINPATACGGSSTSQTKWVATVSVQATATFQSIFKYPWIPNSITVSRTATIRVDQ